MTSQTMNNGKTHRRVSKSQLFYIGFSNISNFFIGQTVNNALMKFYTDYLFLAGTLFALAFIIFGVWNAINDPILGHISDNTPYDPKKGKRLPFMKKGIPITYISFLVLIFVDPSWSESMIFVFLLIALFFYDLGLAMYSINATAMIVSLTSNVDERTKINMWNAYAILIPGILAALFPMFLFVENASIGQIRVLFIILTTITFIISLLCVYRIEEPDPNHHHEPIDTSSTGNEFLKTEAQEEIAHKEHIQGKNGQPHKMNLREILVEIKNTTLEALNNRSFLYFILFAFFIEVFASTYFTLLSYMLDNVFIVGGIFALLVTGFGALFENGFYPLVRKLRNKHGSVKTISVCLIICIFGYLGVLLTPVDQPWLMLIFYAPINIGLAAYWMLFGIFIGDITDEDRLKTGKDRRGMYSGIAILIKTPANSIMFLIFGIILDLTRYEKGNINPAAATGIRFGATFLPIIFIIIGLLFLRKYPLKGENYKKMREEYEARYD